MKKTILIIVTFISLLLTTALVSASYNFTAKDTQLINALTQKVEQVISEKGEKFRTPLVEWINKLSLQYKKNTRVSNILKQVSSNIDSNFLFYYDKKNGDYYGRLLVKGYITTKEFNQPFCEEDCYTYIYHFFNILDTSNEFLRDYLNINKWNVFIGDNSIGLGCIEDNILFRENDSNQFGPQIYKNSYKESEMIMNSTIDKPITLELNRYLLTTWGAATPCYSHFSKISIVDIDN